MPTKKKPKTSYAVYVGYNKTSLVSVHKTLTEAYEAKEELDASGVTHSIRVGRYDAEGQFQTV